MQGDLEVYGQIQEFAFCLILQEHRVKCRKPINILPAKAQAQPEDEKAGVLMHHPGTRRSMPLLAH